MGVGRERSVRWLPSTVAELLRAPLTPRMLIAQGRCGNTYPLLKRSEAQKSSPRPPDHAPRRGAPAHPRLLLHVTPSPSNTRQNESRPRRRPGTQEASSEERGSSRPSRHAHRGPSRQATLTSSFRERLDTFFSILAAVFSAPRPFFSFLPFLPIAPGPRRRRDTRGDGKPRAARRKYVCGDQHVEVRHFRDERVRRGSFESLERAVGSSCSDWRPPGSGQPAPGPLRPASSPPVDSLCSQFPRGTRGTCRSRSYPAWA